MPTFNYRKPSADQEPGKEISSPLQVTILGVKKVSGATFRANWRSNMYEIQTTLGTYVSSTVKGHQRNLNKMHIVWEDMIGAHFLADTSRSRNSIPTVNQTNGKTYFWLRVK